MRHTTVEDRDEGTRDLPLRAIVATPLIGVATMAVTIVAALNLDLPIQDPEGAALGSPLILIAVVMLAFIALDVVPRAGWPPTRALQTLKERWDLRRLAIVVAALIGFYLTYVGYRNIKSYLPFAREGTNFDGQLLGLDRDMAFGHDPAQVLHDVLGTGVAAQVLSFTYLTFLLFVPLSLGVAVVWQRRLHRGLWYVTAMNFAWLMGLASYYALPSLGPVFVAPDRFAGLPDTGVSQLQQTLLENREAVLAAPHRAEDVQSIAAFASLHVAIVLAAAMIAQLLGLRRAIRTTLWTFLALTTLATIYFGWHYIVDDLAGAAIGIAAVVLGAAATGHELRPARRRQVVVGPKSAGAAEAT